MREETPPQLLGPSQSPDPSLPCTGFHHPLCSLAPQKPEKNHRWCKPLLLGHLVKGHGLTHEDKRGDTAFHPRLHI